MGNLAVPRARVYSNVVQKHEIRIFARPQYVPLSFYETTGTTGIIKVSLFVGCNYLKSKEPHHLHH